MAAGPRPFLRWPDARLKAVAEPVEAVDDAVRALWEEMLAAMYAMPGIGLAAPQIGVGLRLAVVDASEAGDAPVRLANPVLIDASEETRLQQEASPNLPGLRAAVERPARVRVAYLDETGAAAERAFEGPWAQSVQHQIDHLDGRLFIDRLGPVTRKRLLERHRKDRRRERRAR
jgi:peptide deformylase